MTTVVYPELVDALAETFSAMIDDDDRDIVAWTFGMGHDENTGRAVLAKLSAKYPDLYWRIVGPTWIITSPGERR